MGSRLWLAFSVGALMALAGCLGNPVEIQTNEEFSKAVRDFSDTGGRSVPLRKLTDFSWDHVHVFTEGALAESVNSTVGRPVLAEDSSYHEAGNLFVFTSDGSVVKALSVVPDLLYYGRQHTWGPKVRLEAGEPGGTIRLVEPGARGDVVA